MFLFLVGMVGETEGGRKVSKIWEGKYIKKGCYKLFLVALVVR